LTPFQGQRYGPSSREDHRRRGGLLEEKKVNKRTAVQESNQVERALRQQRTTFQELRAALDGKCTDCNGGAQVTTGAKNILIVACDHIAERARGALFTRGWSLGEINERPFKGESTAQGGYSGVAFRVRKAGH
jgi:hypothetical protein